jgi:type IV fimbrial biogenesis protein FimT
MRASRGFTLTELMLTLAVAGVLAAVAVPNMRTFVQNNRLSGASNDLLRSFQMARSEAIKRQLNVVVCASTQPADVHPVCSYGAFNGWVVFEDKNNNWQADDDETVVERHELLNSNLTVRTDKDGIESFSGSGFASPADAKTPSRNVVICDARGIAEANGSSLGRALLISPTGRVRVTKDYMEVSGAADAAGSCP